MFLDYPLSCYRRIISLCIHATLYVFELIFDLFDDTADDNVESVCGKKKSTCPKQYLHQCVFVKYVLKCFWCFTTLRLSNFLGYGKLFLIIT